MSQIKLSLHGRESFSESLVSDIPAGDGIFTNLFYSVSICLLGTEGETELSS